MSGKTVRSIAKLGQLDLSVKHKETVRVPVWAGVVATVVGGALLFLRKKRPSRPTIGA